MDGIQKQVTGNPCNALLRETGRRDEEENQI